MKNNALTYLSKMPGVGWWFTRMGGLWHTWFTCVYIALICRDYTAAAAAAEDEDEDNDELMILILLGKRRR